MAHFLLAALITLAACQQGWGLTCAADIMDLCDYKDAPTPSPVPTPTTTTKSCAANELDLCDYKTAPTPSPAMTTTTPPPVMVTAFDIEFEVTDVTKLGMDQLKAAMAAASQVNADNVEIGSVEYKTKVSYTMPESVSKAAATTAVAKSCNVAESQVEVVVSTSRRLSETRRLATTIAAIIKTTTASEAVSIVTKAKDEAQLKQAFTDAGLTVEPTVTAQPTTSFAAKITLKGEVGAPAPATPLADAIQNAVKANVGIDIVASISNVVKVADWALSASTTMEEEAPADAAKGQNSILWMACAVAATLLLKAI